MRYKIYLPFIILFFIIHFRKHLFDLIPAPHDVAIMKYRAPRTGLMDEISRLCREIKRDVHDSLIETDKFYSEQLKRFHLEEGIKLAEYERERSSSLNSKIKSHKAERKLFWSLVEECRRMPFILENFKPSRKCFSHSFAKTIRQREEIYKIFYF